MLSTLLGLALAFSGPADPSPTAEPSVPTEPEPDAPAGEPGTIVLGPGAAGNVRIVDTGGAPVARVFMRPEQRISVDLPPGAYRLEDDAGNEIEALEVGAGQRVEARLPAEMGRDLPATATPAGPVVSIETVGPPAANKDEKRKKKKKKRHNWRAYVSPLVSTVVPGAGQMINKQYGKGVAILLSTISLAAGSAVLWLIRDPTEGAAIDDGGQSDGREIVRLGAFSAMTSALALLYAGQIMDAHAVAVDKKVEPRTKHIINVDLVRNSTVAFRPGQPAYDLYDDISVSILGQPIERFSVGISDLSIKVARASDRLTLQAGVRLSYRFFDRRRIWLAAGLGTLFQGATGSGQDALEPDGPSVDSESRFGSATYLQLETRIFVLNRWSLNLIPRITMPWTTRYYSGGRSLPRFATTIELGTGLGVYF